ncbi:MAG: hypothetical protein ACOC0F_01040 [archaeon]
MGTYRSVLAAIRRGRPIPAVAEALDRREDAIRGMVRSMVSDGYLRELGCDGETCTSCPMADSCGLAVDGPSSYVVTEAGVAYLDDETEGEGNDDYPPETGSTGQITLRPND